MTPLQVRSAASRRASQTRKLQAQARGEQPKCSRCSGPRTNPNDRYCRRCRAAYMRGYRKTSRETSLRAASMKSEGTSTSIRAS